MHKTGEKPGIGIYRCIACGLTLRLDDASDTLPPCPNCHATTFAKVG
jgi:DNA-directed RNA polymerase subunit RPC12/RpoP